MIDPRMIAVEGVGYSHSSLASMGIWLWEIVQQIVYGGTAIYDEISDRIGSLVKRKDTIYLPPIRLLNYKRWRIPFVKASISIPNTVSIRSISLIDNSKSIKINTGSLKKKSIKISAKREI